jgi:hypothetical protein
LRAAECGLNQTKAFDGLSAVADGYAAFPTVPQRSNSEDRGDADKKPQEKRKEQGCKRADECKTILLPGSFWQEHATNPKKYGKGRD